MQLDMHYYGTYALARSAGINPTTARTIATCAQFVDDNVAGTDVNFRDGSRIDSEATAHHPIDSSNLDERDQRRVWVPFHFLPGNEGESYTERLKCRKDSAIAKQLCEHHLSMADREFAPALMGVLAHVYADTFSHYGFSGVSSRGNKVVNDSFRFHEEIRDIDTAVAALEPSMREYVTTKAEAFFGESAEGHGGLFKNIISWVADFGAIGHGSVATYPDRPYLVWRFEYEREDATVNGTMSIRHNPITFLEGCRALHGLFLRFAAARPDLASGDGRNFDSIEHRVLDVLLVQGAKSERVAGWQAAAQEGVIFGSGDEHIPEYEGETWNEQWAALDGADTMEAGMLSPVWKFYQAASIHRTYVLRDLLPSHGLIVD